MPMAFGPGPQLAAQCPRVPTPDGWRPWTDEDGPIPVDLAKRAQAVSDDQNTPMGATESFPLPGVIALIRLEPRVWARDAQGNFMEGCFRATGVYLPGTTTPVSQVTPPSEDSSPFAKTIGVLTVGSLAVGIIATIASWRKKK